MIRDFPTEDARDDAIEDALRQYPGSSAREIARIVGCSHPTVLKVRRRLAARESDQPGESRWRPSLSALDALDERVQTVERQVRQLVSDVTVIVRENRELRRAVGE